MTAAGGERRTVWLVGDIGGTNARFGLVSPDGAILHSASFPAADFAGIGPAIDAFLAQILLDRDVPVQAIAP